MDQSRAWGAMGIRADQGGKFGREVVREFVRQKGREPGKEEGVHLAGEEGGRKVSKAGGESMRKRGREDTGKKNREKRVSQREGGQEREKRQRQYCVYSVKLGRGMEQLSIVLNNHCKG